MPLARDAQLDEVFLTFNYKNLFNRVVTAKYEDGTFYLPISELFTTLKISHDISQNPPNVNGFYLKGSQTFIINFESYTATFKEQSFQYSASDMIIGETDFYVTPKILSEVFGLHFSVDFNNLLLQLETKDELPIVAEQRRASDREHQQRYSLRQDYYPLTFDRNPKLLSGGYLDYSLSSNINSNINNYSYRFGLGTEVLGGDLQGSAAGNYSDGSSDFSTNNIRWRRVWRHNPNITQLYAGQALSNGLNRRSFVGLRATNEPVEPRYIYDDYEIEGSAMPGSEVELYFNNALYDYQQTNEDGRYRFLAPLTYGSSRLQLRIFKPSGGVQTINRRIRVPFNFLPSGDFNYDVSLGRLDNPVFGTSTRGYMAQGSASYGLTNWLTQKVGTEYLEHSTRELPLFYSTTSARLFNQYLLNLDVAPSAFYRISSSVVYSSSASWNMEYSYFTDNGIYNTLNNRHELNGYVYLPFSAFNRKFNFRARGRHNIQQNAFSNTSYSIDLSTRFDRLNIRSRYSDSQGNNFSFRPSISSQLSSSATYFFSRSRNVPRYLRETFLRAQLSYNPNLSELIQAGAQISRSIFRNGRVQASFSRNFRSDFNQFRVGLTIDFPGTRSTSSANISPGGSSFTQNVIGSVGFDPNAGNLLFSNRQQVGRSSTAVRLFVDDNNSGRYEEGEEIIKNEAVRLS